MRILKAVLVFCFLFSFVLLTFPKVEAESKTIVVPEDYFTIQEAVSNAADGDTVLVKKGIYPVNENTTIVISKTLSLIGEDPANTVILGASHTYNENGIAMRLAAPNITIKGFTITKFKVAIAIANYNAEPYPSECKITNNNIVNNSEGIRPQRNGLLISENNITQNYIGIAGYNTENILITRNNISENGYGINIGVCRNITVRENQISGNNGGLSLYYYGPHFVYGNNITNNNWGIRFAEACGNAAVYGNSIIQNGVGVVLLNFPNAGDVVISGVGNTVFDNSFVNNTKQVSQEERNFGPNTTRMGTDIISWDNGGEGNYWSGFNNTDADGDGIGDMPYIIDENNTDRYPLMLPFNIEHGTVQLPQATSPPFFTATPTLQSTATVPPTGDSFGLQNSAYLIATTVIIAAVAVLIVLVAKKKGKYQQYLF